MRNLTAGLKPCQGQGATGNALKVSCHGNDAVEEAIGISGVSPGEEGLGAVPGFHFLPVRGGKVGIGFNAVARAEVGKPSQSDVIIIGLNTNHRSDGFRDQP